VSVARTILLAASTNKWLREHAIKTDFVRRSVASFMPGERLEDAMAVAATYQRQGIDSILTRLGENLTRVEDAESVASHYLDALDKIASAGLRAQISVKPTQLGLDFDAELCLRRLQRLIDRAADSDSFVWIDMERSTYVDRTLDLFKRTRARSSRVGVALQACLYRTRSDLESLLPLGAAIRLVKGAYLEPRSIAFAKKADVDTNFYELACRALEEGRSRAGSLLHIATHDRRLIDRLAAFIDDRRLPSSAYEYAMLFGIQRSLQQEIARSGRPVRVLISYGDDWFPWYMRRLAERPANLWFVIKNVVAN
jgi:proline dehydrogenase